jgi:hypothetical protein
MRSSAKILALIGVVSIALVAVCTRLGFPGELAVEYGVTLRIFVALVCFSGLLYLGAVAIVLRGDLPRRAFWGILACAALMRLLVLPLSPFLSTDVYRYVWDGRVQAAGISPYRYIPDAPELQALRDDEIHPQINRAHYAPTIYPPVAQAIFFLVGSVSSTVVAMKVTMVLFEALAIFAIIKLLAAAGLPRERILTYAWNPLPIWEFAGNGHIDAAAIGFIALALLACARGRAFLVGMALGAATLVKFLPVVLFPALWRRWDMKMPAGFAAVAAGFYLCYAGVGWKVFGFLSGYFSEEGLKDGSGFYYPWVLERFTASLPAAAYPALVLILLGVLAWRVAFAGKPPANERAATLALMRNTLLLATALMIVMTPHYAWYFAWLALPACLVPSFSVLYLTVAAFFLYLDPGHTELLWRGLVYGVFPVLAIAEFWWHRRGSADPAVSAQWRTTR